MIGRTLNHYRIVCALGKGGMGEVYAAEDTRLHRLVALKILPPASADDPDRLARFRREAEVLAALNHPHVVTVYSVEEDADTHFLTMELVEGATLAEILPARGFPLPRLLRLAIPLVDAVAAAHAHDVVHRDLKPSNVMVGPDDRVKVLDFGLAKLQRAAGEASALATTLASTTTGANVLLGTPAYMSPEQIEGRAIEPRTDIFSLGVLLYEMATGGRPFRGESSISLASSILKDTPPPILEARSDLPPDLDRIVRRCLAKDPSRRFQTAADLRNELEELQQSASATTAAAAVWAAWALLLRPRARPSPAPLATFRQLTSQPGAELFGSLSPDGGWVVYAGEGAGNRDIYLQSTTGQTAINLTADSPADDEQPAFSPDGERIAFRSGREGGGIFVMGRTGEAVRRVTRGGFNPAWSPDGKTLAYTTGRMELRPQNSEGRSELWIVEVSGGEPRRLYGGDAIVPSWSPGGGRIAFSQRLQVERNVSLHTIAASGGEPVFVHGTKEIEWNPVWSPDGRYLYYSSDKGGSMNLWRIALDETSGQPRGEPQPITTPATFLAHLSVSGDGRRLAYSSVVETQNIQALPFDPLKGVPDGEPVYVTTGSRRWSSPDPSPDGEWIACYTQVQPEGDLYVVRPDGTGLRQVTGDAAVDRVPRWSPDGQWIAAFSDRSGEIQVWKIRFDGSDLQQVTSGARHSLVAWSPDGSRLAVAAAGESDHDAQRDLLLMDARLPWAAQAPKRHAAPPPLGLFVPNSWSPDGRRIAGQYGFATPGIVLFSIADGRFERVTEIGEWPVWLPDGERILFVSRGREFHVLDTRTRESRRVFSVARDTLGPPRLTRDGRFAYFSRRVTEADLWLANLE
ncbi:MAG: protein kinase [Thermoanaerobaculia bacterium]|nr:MAG: protein kinase [Thermoanaerobaculia bacterium]